MARDWLLQNLAWAVPVGLLLLFLPALAIFAGLAWRFGRDPRIPRAPDYVREPPSEDSPALVGALVREGQEIGPPEFLATFFDLIRRGYFAAEHARTEQRTWKGLRTELVSDLRLRRTGKDPADLPLWDRQVHDAVADVVPEDGAFLSELGDAMKAQARTFQRRFEEFRRSASGEVRRRDWIDRRGRRLWGAAISLFGAVGILAFAIALFEAGSGTPRLGILLGVLAVPNAILLGILGKLLPKSLTRRTRRGAELVARWEGLGRYLEDFSAMRDAPPISLVLWEQLLVYAIVLGVAERVLEAAQLAAPAELAEASQLYWLDGDGLGGGLTVLRMGTLMSGIGRAAGVGAPASVISGLGGGFSGEGFGGGRRVRW